MSSTTRSRGGRRQSKRIVPEELSLAQIKRLEEELVKFPNPSIYYKKKIASKFAQEFGLNDKI